MDENKQKDEFSLEDILKEFGIEKTEFTGDEDVRVWDKDAPQEENIPIPEETVRFQPISEQTVRFQPVRDETVRFQPVGDEDVREYRPQNQPEEENEPFSKEWEPEYEQPIGEYVPLQPIVFRPKNRLRELKRKLVEGPERRYYELEEVGVGKLQAAIFLSILVLLAAIGSVTMYEMGLVAPERIRLMVFGQLFLAMMAALLGSYQLLGGMADLFRKRFSLNTLLVFSFLACCADGILCLQQVRVPCCAAFCLHVTLSLCATYQKRQTELAQMDTMRKATRLNSLSMSQDYYEGRPGYLRGEGQVEDFWDFYNLPSGPEKVLSVYALVALFISIAFGIAAGVMDSVSMGLQAFSAALLVSVPASAHVALSRPAALLQNRLSKHGSVICGWRGVKGLSRPAAFPLTDTDLFPSGSVKFNGLKFYGSRNPDEVVAYAAALICTDGGSMAPLMSQLLESRNGFHYDATEMQSYPGGIGGIVEGEAVLAGTLSFIQTMGVEMPKGTKVSQAVYVAIDGQLCGVFAVNYAKVKSSAVGFATLCAYRRLTPVITTGDFMLTDHFLRGKFGVNVRRVAFPDRATRVELASRKADEEEAVLALCTQENLAGYAYAVTGSRALRSSCIAGTVVHMLGGILGLLIVGALVAVKADHLLTSCNILLYQLVWLIPGWLITEWTRSV
jgi:hypothetical protein